MSPIIAIVMVFIACCANMFFLEEIVKFDPAAGNLVTFTQFVFISMEGMIFVVDLGRKKSSIPMRHYFIMVLVFFSVQISNNYAFNFNISITLHMIYRSGSLLANLILGVIILKKSYSLSKYLGVMMITLGIVICTLKSASTVSSKESVDGGYSELIWWLLGICCLSFALFMSGRLGIFQEEIARQYGKHPRETMFYCHALPLPTFIFLYNDISTHFMKFYNSDPVTLPLVEYQMPSMLLILLLNMLTQYVCIRSVYVLTTEYSSLIVTLVVTLRKFVSLVISIFYFQNPFTIYHWFGTALVFGGTLIFMDVFNTIKQSRKPKEE